MRLILECHTKIQCCDESIAYPLISGKRRLAAEGRRIGLKVPCLTEQLGNPSLCYRNLLPEVANVYRGQPIIFMLRDVRDTVLSMRNLRTIDGIWLDTHLIPALWSKIVSDPVFNTRYAAQIQLLETTRRFRLACAALYWRCKTEALWDYYKAGFPVLPVRYEDLVTDAPKELRRVCECLQVPLEPALLRHQSVSHGELCNGLAIGDTDPTRPIDSQSVGRWREAFTDAEVEEILKFAGDIQASIYSQPSRD